MFTKIIFPFVAGVFVFVCGLYMGYNTAHSDVVSAYDDHASINLRNEVKILKHLRNGETDSAKELLEELIDVDVSYLGVKWLTTNTAEKKVLLALSEAKDYRHKYPHHKPNKAVAKTVEETFQKITRHR